MTIALPTHMTVDEFLAWAVRQETGRYELFDGRVVMQQPQSWIHADLCWRIRGLLTAAIERARVPFYAAPMGMTVRISEKRAFEPDALVAPLPQPRPADLEISNPIVVVEVLSPSTARGDRTDKLDGYFRVPSVLHYLVIDPARQEIVWHRRGVAGGHQPPVPVRNGALTLDPPGITLELAEIFPAEQEE
jgi:Uma2 family endonuclease